MKTTEKKYKVDTRAKILFNIGQISVKMEKDKDGEKRLSGAKRTKYNRSKIGLLK